MIINQPKNKLMTNKDYFKKVLEEQVGGSHYKERFEIEPAEFILKNRLDFATGCAIKYLLRHPFKNGKEDLLKAKHYIDMLIARDYE